MKNKEDINNSAFYYSVNMLRHLLKMNRAYKFGILQHKNLLCLNF